MTTKELIKQLSNYSPDEKVYISIDGEGNEIKAIYEVCILETDEDTENQLVIWPV